MREKDESSQPEEAGQQGILDQVLAGIVNNEPAKQIEYALLAGLLTTGVIVFINNVGTKVYDYFQALDTAIPPVAAP